MLGLEAYASSPDSSGVAFHDPQHSTQDFPKPAVVCLSSNTNNQLHVGCDLFQPVFVWANPEHQLATPQRPG